MKPLAGSILIPLRLTTAPSQADAGIHEKLLGSVDHPSSSALHNNTIIAIWNDEMKDIIKIVKCLEDSSLLAKKFKRKIKSKEENFLVCY